MNNPTKVQKAVKRAPVQPQMTAENGALLNLLRLAARSYAADTIKRYYAANYEPGRAEYEIKKIIQTNG